MYESENAKANTVTAEHQIEPNQYVKIVRREHAVMKVLFVGNSITRHAPAPEIGWHGDWGMAASSIERDYVHQVVADLERRVGMLSYCIVQMAEWERQYFTGERVLNEWYTAAREFAADIVIIRIGENIDRDKNKEIDFKPYYRQMIEFVSGNNPAAHILVTDNFWKIEVLDKGIAEVAAACGYTLCRIGDLEKDEKTMALGAFEHQGVSRHPSDYGMRRIADRIMEKLEDFIWGFMRTTPSG